MSENPPGPPFPHFLRSDHPLYIEGYNEALKDVLLDENLWLKWNDREYVKAYLRALRKKVID